MQLSPGARDIQRDVPRTTFAVLLTGILILFSFWVLLPFLPALAWAAMIVIASWPIMLHLQRLLGGSRKLATIGMTLMLVFVLLLPLSVALFTVVDNVDVVTQWAREVLAHGVPQPPDWLSKIPLIGPKLAMQLQTAAATMHREEVLSKMTPYIGQMLGWVVAVMGGAGVLFVHFALTVILAAVLYSKGEAAADLCLRLARRLASQRGEGAVILAAQSIRAVALGVVVTALIQTLMAAIGFMLVDVPYVGILTSILFLLCIIQIGAAPVLLGVVIYLYERGQTVAAIFFLLWAMAILSTEYFLRPILVRRGANIPLLLVFAGVIGGLVSFGIIGLFVGPAILAVSFALLNAWIDYSDELQA